jgi:hypothetical protein
MKQVFSLIACSLIAVSAIEHKFATKLSQKLTPKPNNLLLAQQVHNLHAQMVESVRGAFINGLSEVKQAVDLSDEVKEYIKELVIRLDSDKDGSINAQELAVGLN